MKSLRKYDYWLPLLLGLYFFYLAGESPEHRTLDVILGTVNIVQAVRGYFKSRETAE